MKYIILTFFLSLSLSAQLSDMGIGIMVGEPTGISAKLWKNHSVAYQGGVAWSFGNKSSLHLHADYIFHDFNFFNSSKNALYYGLGARTKLADETRIGVRGIIGVNYFFKPRSLDAFIELSPVFDLISKTDFSINAAIGLRYFFAP